MKAKYYWQFPWNPPLFSERIGKKKPIFKLFGFRLFKGELLR